MSIQPFPSQEPLANEKTLTSEKPSHRTSVFEELDDLPRLCGREPQSVNTGKSSLAPCLGGEKGYSLERTADGYRAADISRHLMPADYGYDMPQRYGGKEIAYGENPFVPLAGNNNTWVPRMRKGRFVDLAKWRSGPRLASLASW